MAIDDAVADPGEFVTLALQESANYLLGTYEATVQIVDDETPLVTVTKIADGAEGGANGLFRFHRDKDTTSSLAITYTVTGTATASADFTALSGSVTFPIGVDTVDVPVAILNDSEAENTETLVATLTGGGTSYIVGTPSVATVNIADNELPVVSVATIADPTEGGALGLYRFSRLGDLIQSLPVYYSIGGTASGADFTALSGSVNFTAGAASADAFVNAIDDSNQDPGETIVATITSAAGYEPGTPNSATMTIEDNDGAPAGPVGSGTGLFARYYNTKYFTDVKLARVDRTVPIEPPWGELQAPIPEVGADYFSVRWVGQVQAQFTENYKFHTLSDDGVRLWVNGQLVIDNWSIHSPMPNDSNEIALVAGQRYDIKLEYFEETQRSVIQLLWSSPSTPKAVIPEKQLYPVHLDLDVNANDNLTDLVDLGDRYLPGYEGNVQKVSPVASFKDDVYQGQAMKLIVNGVGTNWAAVTRVVFEITTVSRHGGYASNRSGANVGLDDYSFEKTQDKRLIEITPTTMPAMGGQMAANQTWVHFYAKDYGGAARAEARIYLGGAQPAYTIPLQVPTDTDNDGLADKWEIAMGARRTSQYGLPAYSAPTALSLWNLLGDDNEMEDPDGPGQCVDQKGAGDAHSILEEYRGYILDGGGLDGTGANGHAGGHIRLDPSRKETLVEVDHAAILSDLPAVPGVPMGGDQATRLKHILNGSTKVFSNAQRGAGIYMYYLFDQTALIIPKADVDDPVEIVTKLRDTRNSLLRSDFMHLLLFNEGILDANGSPAVTADRPVTNVLGQPPFMWNAQQQLDARGSAVATTDLHNDSPEADFPKRDELLMTTIAHELVHILIDKTDGAFDAREHTSDPNGMGGPDDADDLTCLMTDEVNKLHHELATVKFFPVVQAELSTKTGEWGTP